MILTLEWEKNLRSSPRRWLVTGGAGFIGSNICEYLLNLGQEVVVLDNLSTGLQKNIDFLNGLKTSGRFTFMNGDIRNPETCRQACEKIDYILNQAALGSVPRSFEFPDNTNQNNVGGFLNMLEAARLNKIKRFVYASSSSVYGDLEKLPKVEPEIGKPLSPYALSKSMNEQYGTNYFKWFELPTVGLRYFNVFGPRQNPLSQYAAVIPKWITAMKESRTIQVYGDGQQSRDFCFVENAIQANLMGALTPKSEAFGKVFNIACGDRVSLLEVIENLQALSSERSGSKPVEIEFLPERKGDVKHSQANIDLARELLLYVPNVRFKEGIAKTFAWFSQNQ